MLIHSGKTLRSHLIQEKVGEEELLQALREHGIATIDEVQDAVLEVDGSISVIRKDELTQQAHRRIRILSGNVR